MTQGESIVWVSILVLGALGVRQINQKKKWGLVVKMMGGLVLLGILVGVGMWTWALYRERPRPMNELGELSLGMSPLDVSLTLGKPSREVPPGETDGSRRLFYEGLGGVDYFVKFSDVDNGSIEQVEIICTNNYLFEIFGLGKYDSEKDVIKKIGPPTTQSIRIDGLAKIISYKEWNVAFEIQKGDIMGVCVTSNGEVSYLLEHEG